MHLPEEETEASKKEEPLREEGAMESMVQDQALKDQLQNKASLAQTVLFTLM